MGYGYNNVFTPQICFSPKGCVAIELTAAGSVKGEAFIEELEARRRSRSWGSCIFARLGEELLSARLRGPLLRLWSTGRC